MTIDARCMDLIDVVRVGEVYPLPTTRSASAILRDVVQHGLDYPSHGHNCIDMDQFIRELRNQVTSSVLAWTPEADNSSELWEFRMNAATRVKYVVQASMRYL